MQFLTIFFPTFASKALKGSSKIYISLLLYKALAMLIRALCPPDKLIPFSPISVISPPISASKSGFNSHMSKI